MTLGIRVRFSCGHTERVNEVDRQEIPPTQPCSWCKAGEQANYIFAVILGDCTHTETVNVLPLLELSKADWDDVTPYWKAKSLGRIYDEWVLAVVDGDWKEAG